MDLWRGWWALSRKRDDTGDAMEDNGKKPDITSHMYTRQVMMYVVGFSILAGLLTLPSTIIGAVASRLAPTMRRLERAVIGGTFLVALFLAPAAVVGQPVSYTFRLFHISHGPLWPIPVLGILLIGALYWMIFDVLLGTKVGGRMRTHIATTVKSPIKMFAKESLIPTAGAKARIQIATPPGGIVAPPHLVHSPTSTAEFGKRDIVIALGEKGTPITINEAELGMHGVILGATGSGKTVTIGALAAALMDLGWSGLLLDLKEDIGPGGLRDFCSSYASHHAVPFQQMALSDPSSPCWLNPLAGMDADFARDTILSLTDFDDAYWQNLNKKMLGQLVNLCYDAHAVDPVSVPYPTINGIGRILETGNLNAATKKMRALVAASGMGIDELRYSAMAAPDKAAQDSAAGFGAKLTQMYDTIAGRTVLVAGDGRRELDVMTEGLTYIGLDSTGKPDLAKLISSAVLQRMSVYAAQRTVGMVAKGQPRFLIIDEASVVDRSILQALLSKARGAGVCVIVCTQGPHDWIDKTGDDWAMLINNINVGIIMAQGSPEAAEMCAEFIGQRRQFAIKRSVGGGEDKSPTGSVSEDIDFIVDPHEIRGLSIGEAILRVNKPTERVNWVKILRRDPTK